MESSKVIEHIIRLEGGYINHPKDPGGETKYGISKRTYPDLDIKELTKEDAELIYFRDFWSPMGIEYLPGKIQFLVMDCGVNQGPVTAIIILQKILGVKADGIVGTNTIVEAGMYDEIELVKRYAIHRYLRYTKTENFDTFGGGWTRRLIEAVVLSMA
jgi:lysozyme family protein